MTWEEYNLLFHKEQLNLVAFKRLMDCDEEVLRLVNRAIENEREACAKLCDLVMLQNQETINELEEDEHIAQCFIQGAMTQLVKTSNAIRARGGQA